MPGRLDFRDAFSGEGEAVNAFFGFQVRFGALDAQVGRLGLRHVPLLHFLQRLWQTYPSVLDPLLFVELAWIKKLAPFDLFQISLRLFAPFSDFF
jgi:hypothetical protein